MTALVSPAHEPPGRTSNNPIRVGRALNDAHFRTVRRRAVLEGCKWDPQVGDTATLAPFPLVLSRAEWNRLASWAEELSEEMAAAERELGRERPELIDRLGFPRALRRVLKGREPWTPSAARMIRFDFHFTRDGWRISEANSDVPGGYTEASFFTGIFAAHAEGLKPAGDPANAWADAVADSARGNGPVGLLAAPGYMEDLQIIAFMAKLLAARGCATVLCDPSQIVWEQGRAARIRASGSGLEPFGALVRFYQSEWLARWPVRSGWAHFFRGGRTPSANPGFAVLTESKRFPLTWEELAMPMTRWRALLPETCDPRCAPWRSEPGWLLKSAMCNTGDEVVAPDLAPPAQWKKAAFAARWFPGRWIAQRRFETLPLETPAGALFPCVGVYTLNGRCCGAYARLGRSPVVNYAAMDVALLIDDCDEY